MWAVGLSGLAGWRVESFGSWNKALNLTEKKVTKGSGVKGATSMIFLALHTMCMYVF